MSLCASILPLAAGLLRADDAFDLKRITPVPANMPIPLSDFFRPGLLREPKLSPSGTHIAAIVTAGEDSHLLLVYDVKTQKYEVLGIAATRT